MGYSLWSCQRLGRPEHCCCKSHRTKTYARYPKARRTSKNLNKSAERMQKWQCYTLCWFFQNGQLCFHYHRILQWWWSRALPRKEKADSLGLGYPLPETNSQRFQGKFIVTQGLHEVGAMHRDFKVANVLLHNSVCKIADLGFAKQM